MHRLSGQQKLDNLHSFWSSKSFHDPLWRMTSRNHAGMNAVEAGAQSESSANVALKQFHHRALTKSIGSLFSKAVHLGAGGNLAFGLLPAAKIAKLVLGHLLTNSRRDAAFHTAQRLFQNRFEEPAIQARIESFSGNRVNADLASRIHAGERTTAFGGVGSFGSTPQRQPASGGSSRGSGGGSTTSGQSGPIAITIHALDSKSVLDRGSDIANALRAQLQLGHPVSEEIRNSVQMG